MPSISDWSGIVKGRSSIERRGKLLFFTPKRNERETRHVVAAATRLHLPPEAIRNLVELVRSRRRFSGVENRPHIFQWRTREKVLGEIKKLKCAFCWAAADLFMWYSDNTEYYALRLSACTSATGQISIANWHFWVVLFAPLPSHSDNLRAATETLIVLSSLRLPKRGDSVNLVALWNSLDDLLDTP